MNEREDLLIVEQALGRARRLEHSGLTNLSAQIIAEAEASVSSEGAAMDRLRLRMMELHIGLKDGVSAWRVQQTLSEDASGSVAQKTRADAVEELLQGANPASIEGTMEDLKDGDEGAVAAARSTLKTLLSVRLTHLRVAHVWREKWLREWHEARPKDAFATWHLARALYSLEDFEDAEHLLNQLSVRFPHRRGVLNLLGRSQFKNGKTDAAIESWQQSLEIDPKQGAIHFALGRALLISACRS